MPAATCPLPDLLLSSHKCALLHYAVTVLQLQLVPCRLSWRLLTMLLPLRRPVTPEHPPHIATSTVSFEDTIMTSPTRYSRTCAQPTCGQEQLHFVAIGSFASLRPHRLRNCCTPSCSILSLCMTTLPFCSLTASSSLICLICRAPLCTLPPRPSPRVPPPSLSPHPAPAALSCWACTGCTTC
jgi:hypothetical protein